MKKKRKRRENSTMVAEGDPSDLIKVVHLLVLSFTWGMQVWVSFIAGFALIKQVTLHTFGLVQSKLFPVYFYCLVASTLVSLTLFAVYHPRDLLDWYEGLQIGLYLLALVMAALNARWFGPAGTEVMFMLFEVEKEHGLGQEVGLGSQKEGYTRLKEQDPKYKASKKTFGMYHGLSQLCNLIGFLCTTTNLVFTALNLRTI